MRLPRGMMAALADGIRWPDEEIVFRASTVTTEATLERRAPRIDLRNVTDVSASHGRWSPAASRQFSGRR